MEQAKIEKLTLLAKFFTVLFCAGLGIVGGAAWVVLVKLVVLTMELGFDGWWYAGAVGAFCGGLFGLLVCKDHAG